MKKSERYVQIKWELVQELADNQDVGYALRSELLISEDEKDLLVAMSERYEECPLPTIMVAAKNAFFAMVEGFLEEPEIVEGFFEEKSENGSSVEFN